MCYKDLTGYISVLIFLLILSFFPTPFFTYPIPIFIYLCIKYNFFSYFENTFKSIIEKLEAANKPKKKKNYFYSASHHLEKTAVGEHSIPSFLMHIF